MKLKIAIGLAVPLLALTACGGGGGEDPEAGFPSAPANKAGTASKGRFYDLQLKYTQCMRRNGLQDWPDPKLSGHPDMPKVEKIQQRLQSGSDAQFRAGQKKLGDAMRACAKERVAAENEAPKRNQRASYEAMLRHAKCMRKNGLAGFGNPEFVDGNAIPGGESDPTKPKLDPGSPAYKRAQQACRSLLPDGVEQ